MAKTNTNTLKETLNTLPTDELVYLGTKEGSGFIAILSADEMIKSINKIDIYYRKECQSKLDNSISKIERLPIAIVSNQIAIANETDEANRAKLNSKIENALASLVGAVNSRNENSMVLRTWKSLSRRKVVDKYPHTTDEPGTTIIIEGKLFGDLWWKGEKKINF